jgi:uncharacterized protein (TIGR03435 family)
VITRAYDFAAYQFPPNHPCCQARFDFVAKVPAGTTKEEFRRMLQNLLAERFHLALHYEQKEMPVFTLTVAEHGLKMKPSALYRVRREPDPWEITPYSVGEDGYPEFPAGRTGQVGIEGRYRWTAYSVPVTEIVKTLSFYLGRPVIDATGLDDAYDVDLKWGIDIAWLLERAGRRDEIPGPPDSQPPGPSLLRAVPDQLGLKLTSEKGQGKIVVIDHLDKFPAPN